MDYLINLIISGFLRNSDLDIKMTALATKTELNIEHDKIKKIRSVWFKLFLRKKSFWRWWSTKLFSISVLQYYLVLKTFSKRFAKMSSRHLQYVFKTYLQVKLFLLICFQDVFETSSTRFWNALRRWLATKRFA